MCVIRLDCSCCWRVPKVTHQLASAVTSFCSEKVMDKGKSSSNAYALHALARVQCSKWPASFVLRLRRIHLLRTIMIMAYACNIQLKTHPIFIVPKCLCICGSCECSECSESTRHRFRVSLEKHLEMTQTILAENRPKHCQFIVISISRWICVQNSFDQFKSS